MAAIYFPTDKALVQKALQGDKTAFGRLFDRHVDRVFHMVRRLAANDETAKDLTQETFISAYTTLETWRADATFSTWLCAIAVRRYTAARRRSSQNACAEYLEDEDESAAFVPNDDPLAHYKRREAETALSEAIASLSDSCRDIFVLIRIEEMSYQAVAELLEIPLGTVQSRLHRATRFLHQRLSPLIYGSDAISRPHSNKRSKL